MLDKRSNWQNDDKKHYYHSKIPDHHSLNARMLEGNNHVVATMISMARWPFPFPYAYVHISSRCSVGNAAALALF